MEDQQTSQNAPSQDPTERNPAQSETPGQSNVVNLDNDDEQDIDLDTDDDQSLMDFGSGSGGGSAGDGAGA